MSPPQNRLAKPRRLASSKAIQTSLLDSPRDSTAAGRSCAKAVASAPTLKFVRSPSRSQGVLTGSTMSASAVDGVMNRST